MLNRPHKKYARYCSFFIFLIVFIYSVKGVAMSLLFGTEVVVFSPIEGKITYQGKAVADAEIILQLFWKDDVGEKESYRTNNDGEFRIPIKTDKVRISPLAEFVVTQQISVFIQGEEYVIWYKSILNPDEYGGLGGYPKNLHCELTDERTQLEGYDGIFSTSCKWDSVVKKGDK